MIYNTSAINQLNKNNNVNTSDVLNAIKTFFNER